MGDRGPAPGHGRRARRDAGQGRAESGAGAGPEPEEALSDASDPRRRFTAAAEDYRKHRPSYPEAALDWLIAEAALAPGARVVDVGCGTGIFSRLLADRGLRVVGIDPNAAMLSSARAEGCADYVRAEAAATGLRDGAADLVVCAQSFHWFDADQALAEFRRILRGSGRAAALWNVRAGGAFLEAYDALLRGFSDEYGRMPGARTGLDALRERSARGDRAVAGLHEARFAHAQVHDVEGLLGRARSSSYVAHGVRDRDGFERALRDLFDAHQSEGRVEMRYETIVLLWQPAYPIRNG